MIIITKEDIIQALSFYNINNEDYLNNCLLSAKIINNSENINKKFHQLYNILYKDQKEIEKLWNYHQLEALFKNNYCKYITNLLLLLGYKYHDYNINKLNFSKNQLNIHKLRVKECLTDDIYKKGYESIRISQMLWGVYFINCRLIEIGRLQYENCQTYIKIHIPRGAKLEIKEVLKSINNSKKPIKSYFNIDKIEYHCNTWLLSPDIKQFLEKDSNISKFQSLFNINFGISCLNDILNFVFNENENIDFKKLPENTTLQRKIKKYLLDGNDIKIGIGILKK